MDKAEKLRLKLNMIARAPVISYIFFLIIIPLSLPFVLGEIIIKKIWRKI